MPQPPAALLPLLAAIAALPALAQQPAADGAAAPVTCQVAGYDVVIVNSGPAPLLAGTAIAWEVRFARMAGVHDLAADLAPGAVHILTGALGSSYLGTRTPCRAAPAGEAEAEADGTAAPTAAP